MPPPHLTKLAVLLPEGPAQGTAGQKARLLAQRLNLPLLAVSDVSPGMVMTFNYDRLQLQQTGAKAPGPIAVDFADQAFQRRLGTLPRAKHPLARAIGHKEPLPTVLDATAGLGRDAAVLANLGYQVMAFERSPVLAALLDDGLQRAGSTSNHPPAWTQRLQLHCSDAREWLAQCTAAEAPDVIYLDPMFPAKNKSALVKKEMQMLQQLLSPQDDALQLLQLARQVAKQRVVLKRPTWAAAITDEPPQHSVLGVRVRWDVFLRKKP